MRRLRVVRIGRNAIKHGSHSDFLHLRVAVWMTGSLKETVVERRILWIKDNRTQAVIA